MMKDILEQLQTNTVNTLKTLSPDIIADVLRHASDEYYNTGKTVLSDDVFDIIKAHLKKVAPRHPYLKEVGVQIRGDAKVKLPYWMGSLDKIRDDPKQLEKWIAKYTQTYVVSDKLDGNSALVVYTKGSIRMYSRGDGKEGQDISHLIPLIRQLPNVCDNIAVRGELIITKREWDSLKHVGANARNVVAGIMHSKAPSVDVAKHVTFVAYDMLAPSVDVPSQRLKQLARYGFETVYHATASSSVLTMEYLSNVLVSRRTDSPYEIDGIVIMHDEVHKIVRGKNPSFAFAFKSMLTHEEAEVVVHEVEWNASKDGLLKPIVHFGTVVLAGVKISKATGFNAQYIQTNVIGPGSRVVIIRSGDVIPHIVRVLTPAASGTPSFPTDMEYVWNETKVDIVIKGASSQVDIKQMEHFCTTLDVKNVARGTLKKLYDHGINTIPKLLRLTESDVLRISGFKEASAKRIVDGITHAKNTASCTDLMVASNVFGRGFGKKKIELIVETFPAIRQGDPPADVKAMSQVDGIGSVTARAFLDALPKFYAFMDDIGMKCKTRPVAALSPQQPPLNVDFTKQVVVFTGFRNKEWAATIAAAGGVYNDSVTKSTTLVVATNVDEINTKLEKARKLGIPIISTSEFEQKYLFIQ